MLAEIVQDTIELTPNREVFSEILFFLATIAAGCLFLGIAVLLLFRAIKKQNTAMVQRCEQSVKRLSHQAISWFEEASSEQTQLTVSNSSTEGEIHYRIERILDGRYQHHLQVIPANPSIEVNRTLLAAIAERTMLIQLMEAGIDLRTIELDESGKFGLCPTISIKLSEEDHAWLRRSSETDTHVLTDESGQVSRPMK